MDQCLGCPGLHVIEKAFLHSISQAPAEQYGNGLAAMERQCLFRN